jgi:hemerythrin-like domain-containing protein
LIQAKRRPLHPERSVSGRLIFVKVHVRAQRSMHVMGRNRAVARRRQPVPEGNRMAEPLSALYAEHRSIAAVLWAMDALVRQARKDGARVDPKMFRAMLYYLDVFPEREHHPKEESILFPYIRRRSRDGDAILDELRREHETGAAAIRELEQAFVRYEEGGQREFASFARAVERFVGSYREHMRKEEQTVMPLARRVLSPRDWEEIEAAFAAHRDPLAGATPLTDSEQLFHRIVGLLPDPIGLAPPADKG